jgi:hypothetical protein
VPTSLQRDLLEQRKAMKLCLLLLLLSRKNLFRSSVCPMAEAAEVVVADLPASSIQLAPAARVSQQRQLVALTTHELQCSAAHHIVCNDQNMELQGVVAHIWIEAAASTSLADCTRPAQV